MVENVSYWMEIAQYDLETAQAMLQAKRYLYVGFMCHQTAEKSIKALIAATGKFPPKLHNLIELAATAGIYNKIENIRNNFYAN